MNSKTPDAMAVEEAAIRAAISRRLNELKTSAATLADPRPWVKGRPLTSCLVAAGAGMAVGLLAGGRKPVAASQAATEGDHTAAHHRDRQTLGALLAASLVPLQPMIRDFVHSAMGGLAKGSDKVADVAEEPMPSGLAPDNKVVE